MGQQLRTIADIRRANRAAGHHFFEADTMRFFDSRVLSRTIVDMRRRRTLFITSEQFHGSGGYSGPRRYSVRAASWDTGRVSTIREHQGYPTSQSAYQAALDTAKSAEGFGCACSRGRGLAGHGLHRTTKRPTDPTYHKHWSGRSYAPHCKGGCACSTCGERLHREGDSHYCPRCDDYKRPAKPCGCR